VDPRPVVDALCHHGAEFVVVGSAARYLLGEDIVPSDSDLVISDTPANRVAVLDALIELGGYLVAGERLRPLTKRTVLPWEWSFRTVTSCGPIDMIVRFIDGTGYQEHDQAATSIRLNDGRVVRCHGTRHLA